MKNHRSVDGVKSGKFIKRLKKIMEKVSVKVTALNVCY